MAAVAAALLSRFDREVYPIPFFSALFQAGEKLRKDSSFRLPHGNGFARTFALRTLGCLMVTAFASTLFLRFLTPPNEQ